MFNWLFGKREKIDLEKIDILSHLRNTTQGRRDENLKDKLWTKERIEQFYENEFIPKALKLAKQGYSHVNVYELLGSRYNLERYYQIERFLRSKGYVKFDTFEIGW